MYNPLQISLFTEPSDGQLHKTLAKMNMYEPMYVDQPIWPADGYIIRRVLRKKY